MLYHVLFVFVLYRVLYQVILCFLCIAPGLWCKISNSGIEIAPLVPAEEAPHGKCQDWLTEYAGE